MTISLIPRLNPTLWRTCRVLAGPTRLALLHAVITTPNLSVSELGRTLDISESRASQELRRLQSRGILRRHQVQSNVFYQPSPDPQVPTAAPLLSSLRKEIIRSRNSRNAIARYAKGLAHERRIRIVQVLMQNPCTFSALLSSAELNSAALRRHLAILSQTEWIFREGKTISYAQPTHPFAQVLAKLVHSAG